MVSQEGKKSNETLMKNEYGSQIRNSVEMSMKLQGQYRIIEGKIDTSLSAIQSYSCTNVSEIKDESSSEVKSTFTRTYKKQEFLQEQRENIAFLFNNLKTITQKGIFIYLDDFYQIPMKYNQKLFNISMIYTRIVVTIRFALKLQHCHID